MAGAEAAEWARERIRAEVVNRFGAGLIASWGDGITRLATRFTKSRVRVLSRPVIRGEAGSLEFANLPHDFAETLELVFVGITIVVSLAIMVAFGAWWQR